MKKLLSWMGVGILIVAGAFFIPEQNGSIWPSLIMSSIFALAYLIIFCFYWLPAITSRLKKRAIIAILGVFITGIASYAFLSYQDSIKQEKVLTEVRKTIENGITLSRINKPLHITLRDYYQVKDPEANLGDLFMARYDSLFTDNGEYINKDAELTNTLSIYLSKVTSDSVVMIAESNYIKGNDADFYNYSGTSGNFQVTGILTKKGVHYERTN